jgi:hypothetical protein
MLEESAGTAEIPLLRGDATFVARLSDEGVYVTNLGNQPFLPWAVFEQTVALLVRKGGRARKGNAMGPRLGDPELALDSVEGHVAGVVYKKEVGATVFRRISPICAILIWAGICVSSDGELMLSI